MQIHDIKAPEGARKRKRIVGRGPSSGSGKTSGRGQTGQKSRAGRGMINSLEGGQMPLIRRLPKVGFRSKRPMTYKVIKIGDLAKFKAGVIVDAQSLKTNGLIKSIYRPYKVLGNGEIKHALTIKAYGFSKSAAEKITKAGGKMETIDRKAVKATQAKEQDKNK